MARSYILDGYNVIHQSEKLKGLASGSLEAAREQFIAQLEDFCLAGEVEVKVVFDAAATGGPASREKVSESLTVVYTAKGQTADSYIERLAYKLAGEGRKDTIVVTSDYLQQKIVTGSGLLRMSSREFVLEMESSRTSWESQVERYSRNTPRVSLGQRLPKHIRKALNRYKEPK